MHIRATIKQKTISQTEEPGPYTQCEVQCLFCGQAIDVASIQDTLMTVKFHINHQPLLPRPLPSPLLPRPLLPSPLLP
ncbi:unnamed protein product [Gadus morhua 'NCC']